MTPPKDAVEPDAPVLVTAERGVLNITLNRPPGNILDAVVCAAIRAALAEHGRDPNLRAIVLGASGKHFSFGASVKEHRPEEVSQMLPSLHGLFRELMDLPFPCVAAVQGQCLGGGFELMLCASFVFASPDAQFGLPEITLGVFAPFASAILPVKLGQAHAERLLLTGTKIDAERAQAIGLVDAIAADPKAATEHFVEAHLMPRSASSLGFALRAARLRLRTHLDESLLSLEHLYLDQLMATHDAKEGIQAFLEKRSPVWKNR